MDTQINNKLLMDFLAKFFRKLERGRKTIEIVNEDNLYKIINENPDIIEEEIKVTVNKYGVFIDVKWFSFVQDEYKEVFKDYQKYILQNWEAIFGKPVKSFWYFMGKLYFLFKDILNYTTFKQFNEQLDWNYIIYGVDIETLQLLVKREDEVKHNAVYAITRSGKTVLLQNILYSALDRKIYKQYPNLRPECLIIEKSMDFDDTVIFKWITYKGSLEGWDSIDFKDILQMFFYIELSYRYRKNIFKKAWTQKLQDYNAMVSKEEQMWLMFVVIDEFQSVLKKFEWNKDDYKFVVDKIAKVTAVYTDSGIYLYAWTQLYGAEKGIPWKISGNIETLLFGRYIQENHLYQSPIKDTYLTTQAIKQWDFIFNQWDVVNLIRTPLPYSLNLLEKVEEAKKNQDFETLRRLNVLKYKEVSSVLTNCELKDDIDDEDKIEKTIFNANNYMRQHLTKKLEELLEKIWDPLIDKRFSREFLEDYWIDVEELNGMDRFAFIVIANVIKEYISEVRELVESWESPIELDFQNEKDRISNAVEAVSYPLLISKWIWDKYFQAYWKKNITQNVIKRIEKIINDKLMWVETGNNQEEKNWLMIFKILQQKKMLDEEMVQKILKVWYEEAVNFIDSLKEEWVLNDDYTYNPEYQFERDEETGVVLPPVEVPYKAEEIALLDTLQDKAMKIYQLVFKKYLKERNATFN